MTELEIKVLIDGKIKFTKKEIMLENKGVNDIYKQILLKKCDNYYSKLNLNITNP